MRRARRDGNQAELVGYLRDCGFRVLDTAAVGPNAIPGFPDLLCSTAGRVVGVEIKMPGEQLTKDEHLFWVFNGDMMPLFIVRNMQDVLDLTHKIRDEASK